MPDKPPPIDPTPWHGSESGEPCFDTVDSGPPTQTRHTCYLHLEHVEAGADHECCCGARWPAHTPPD